MTLDLGSANEIIRSVIRSIDKRAECTTALVEGDRPGVTVTLSMRKRSTTVMIPIDTLAEAGQNSRRRNQLRTTLKQAFDKMQFVATPVASTKLLRAKTAPDGFFRPPSGGRGGRR